MKAWILLPLVAFSMVFGQPRLGLMKLEADHSVVNAEKSIAFSQLMVQIFKTIPGYEFLSYEEVLEQLLPENRQLLVACTEQSCYQKTLSVLNLQGVVDGEINATPNGLVCNLFLMSFDKALNGNTISLEIPGNILTLAYAIPQMIAELMGIPKPDVKMDALVPDVLVDVPVVLKPEVKRAATQTVNMAQIPAGGFMMGDDAGQVNERPAHKVAFPAFWMDRYEVSQQQYQTIMGANPSGNKCQECPVEQVTWQEAKQYCEKIGKRLPTEAEWEYAARGGTNTKFFWGNSMNGDFVWYGKNYGGVSHPAGKKLPNPWGLYDISGNVAEWCADWFDENYYRFSPGASPKGPVDGTRRIIRGGSWYNDEVFFFSTPYRYRSDPNVRSDEVGFRCAW
jgi:formylglycine-generating enzyme required for sulfatase activity